MKLEKAIEILYDLLGEGPQYPPDDRRDAVRLGIEALKEVKRLRPHIHYHVQQLLSGETED